ncbi:PREDICTED: F-box only protein 8-like [Camelina sativa]|uniref:F-box only protein 8-like n=1 Tax=Camelina sativa TaxID=90675 RepID=A0ABM1QJ55_CAMSA|nr:PREDICTED: F-box only protein 8-like [Camelina sativa]
MHNSITWDARYLPLDLLIEILTRLPAESLLKFKSVSKFWLSLLSSRDFCNRFLTVPSQPRLYMSLMDRRFYSKSLLLSSAVPSPFPSTLEFDQDLTVRTMGGFDPRFLHGFICFMHYLNARIYIPTTRQLYIIPVIKESDIIAEGRDLHNDPYTIQYYMGHDPVNDQYKLLCTIFVEDMGKKRSEYWVYVLESGGSWKRKSVANDFHPHDPNILALCMKGAIYYCAWTDTYTCVLVRFDVRSEGFDMMQVPWRAGEKIEKLTRLEKTVLSPIDYGGTVAVFDITYLKETGTVDL